MRFARALGVACAALLIPGLARDARSQEAKPVTPAASRRDQWLMKKFGDRDVLLAVSSIEWGAPDRWSFTSRYVHMFDSDRDHKRSLNNLAVTLSPGTGGGRLAVGYLNIFAVTSGKPAAASDEGLTLLSEARVVLLRTWAHPLAASANRTFAGAELSTSLGGLLKVGAGYYAEPSTRSGGRDAFWGLHVGVGM